jgi:ubiquinone/menaquinone biosynthesis C-methylase UbiE
VGIDVNNLRIKKAKKQYSKNFQHINPILNINDKLPFENNSFDIIFVSLCLHHIPPKQNILIVKEFNRILKKNGIIIGNEPIITKKHKLSNYLMNKFDRGLFITTEKKYREYYETNNFIFKTKKKFKIVFYNCIYYECSKK